MNLQDKRYLGETKDNVQRNVSVFSDDMNMYTVYDYNTANQYITQERIEKIKSNPDEYLYTPYIEFIDLL